jgi:type I restriction enzyme S subunit
VNISLGVTERYDGDGRPAASEDLSKYKLVQPNDLIMNPLGKPHGSIGMSTVTGITSPAYWVLRCNEGYDPQYLHYLLRSELMINEFKRRSKNLPPNQFDLPWEQFREIDFKFPSLENQVHIARFLNKQIISIDTFLNLRKQQLLINSKLVNSIISSQLSEFKELRKLKYLADIKVSNVDKHSDDAESRVYLCNYVDVYKHRFVTSEIDFMPATASPEQIRSFGLRKGDVLFTKDSETAEDIAMTALVTEDVEDLVLGYHCGLLRATNLIPEYLYWVMQSRYVQNQFAIAATGVTRVGLKLFDIGEVLIPFADQRSQSNVVSELASKVKGIEDLNRLIEKQVNNVKVLKNSVICNTLIGKSEKQIGKSVA